MFTLLHSYSANTSLYWDHLCVSQDSCGSKYRNFICTNLSKIIIKYWFTQSAVDSARQELVFQAAGNMDSSVFRALLQTLVFGFLCTRALFSPMGFLSGKLWTRINSNVIEKIASLLSPVWSILNSYWPSLGQIPALTFWGSQVS